MLRHILVAIVGTSVIALVGAATFVVYRGDGSTIGTGDYVREKCLVQAKCIMHVRWDLLRGYRMRMDVSGKPDCNPEASLNVVPGGFDGRWYGRDPRTSTLSLRLKTPPSSDIVTLSGEGYTCDLENAGMNFLQGDYRRR